MQRPPKFKPTNQTEFGKVLRQRVQAYFKDQGKQTTANTAMYFKTLFYLSFWIGSYLTLMLAGISFPWSLLVWAVLGLSFALVAVNIGHDAIHGAYTKNKVIQHLLEHTFNFNGASAYMWKLMHNTAHHNYTNIHGFDEDISPIPVIRLSPHAELKPVHKYQQWYSFFFYGLATISWVFIKDYVKFFKNEVGNYSGKPHPKKQLFLLFLYKSICYVLYLVLPMLIIQQPWYQILLGFVIMHFVSGFYLAIIFMLAHAIEEVNFPLPNQNNDVRNDWATHQMYTCANFASESRLAGFLTGGLNQQIEHHLFPNICSIHYRPLARIVRETAHEFGLPYYELPSFSNAMGSHVRFLRRMGKEEPAVA